MLFPHSIPSSKQRGAAVIMALFIMTCVVTMTYAMMTRFDRDRQRTQLILNAVQMDYLAQGSIAWAKQNLLSSGELHFPMVSPVEKVQAYTIKTTITDLQRRFNINVLRDNNPEQDAKLVALLQSRLPSLSKPHAQRLLQATRDWINRTPRSLMADISEWQLVTGMTAKYYAALQPWVIALPPAAENTYFLVETEIHLQRQSYLLYTTLHRDLAHQTIRIIQQSKGIA